MNTVQAKRFWLIWRFDIAAAGALIAFGVAAFYAAQNISDLVN